MSFRFGLIGVGNIAPLHARAIAATAGASLVAVATRDEARGRAFTGEYGGEWYGDYRKLLDRDALDAVAICTPHDLHLPMTQAAAGRGLHVLCEKPMARNTAECDAMIGACVSAGVTLGVVFQSRFEPLALRLRELLRTKVGPLLWTSVNTLWYRSDEYYRSGPWRGTWAHEGGGVLINQAIHSIDLAIFLAGMPSTVRAQIATLNHGIEVEDTAAALLEYPGGGMGLIQATTIAYPGYPERLDFAGVGGSAIYHKGEARLEWHIADPREDGSETADVSSGAARPMDISVAGHIAVYADFVAAVREGRAPAVDGHEGRRSVALVEAIYTSAREGRAVEPV